jgi:hypothetical protein
LQEVTYIWAGERIGITATISRIFMKRSSGIWNDGEAR